MVLALVAFVQEPQVLFGATGCDTRAPAQCALSALALLSKLYIIRLDKSRLKRKRRF